MAIRPIIQNNGNTTKLMQYCNRHRHDDCKILTKDEEKALIAEWKDKDPDKLRQMLIMHNVAMVFNMATKFMGATKSFDDLVQEGFIGLTIAANKFDFEKSNKFSTYAYAWIYKYVWARQYVENNGVDPSENAISLDGAIADFANKSKATESDDGEIGNYLENHIDTTFMDESVVSTAVQVERNALSSVYDSMRKYMLSNDFTDIDRTVFNGAFVDNKTLRKISAENDIPTAEVKRSYDKIMAQMRERLAEDGIKSYDDAF